MSEYNLNLPIINQDTKEFWDGCRRHVLLIQKCKDCEKFRFEPAAICPHCLSSKFRWVKVNGRGKIYSYVVYRQAPQPNWASKVPYVIAIVELEDCGVKMITNIVECAPEEVKIDMNVEVVFEDATQDISIPRFKPIL
ncbi:MAG: OB-fold domain-containing protein [Thermodesulfobacteriota bacterium]|nr:OB-fold domain-containing protein [Thermodesulfobacteriota bacterium]